MALELKKAAFRKAAFNKSARAGLSSVASLIGVASAVFLVVLVNVYAARHFTRWDWTSSKRFTLSPATLATLHDLKEPIEIWVILGTDDPLTMSIKPLLVAYGAETKMLGIHYIDPDRDVAELMDLHGRFGVEAGKVDGRVMTDAIAIVARGEKRWFLTNSDMFSVAHGDDPRDDTKAKPREENAFTEAIRKVVAGDKLRICFTTGHSETAVDPVAPRGSIGDLKRILEKDNYELATLDTTLGDATSSPYRGCVLAVVAWPKAPFSADEASALRSFLLDGGNLFLAIGPIHGADHGERESRLVSSNLESVLAPFGIGLDENIVIERDPSAIVPDSEGTAIFAAPREHEVTRALLSGLTRNDPRVLLREARSLKALPNASSTRTDLLVSTKSSFGAFHLKGLSRSKGPLEPTSGDRQGPLAIAMASELPKQSPTDAHGPRIVVVGAGGILDGANWTNTSGRGAAFFVDGAIGWLASRPVVADIPDREAETAAIRISEASRTEIRNYVLFYMPLGLFFLGITVAFWRRSTEGAPLTKAKAKPKSAS